MIRTYLALTRESGYHAKCVFLYLFIARDKWTSENPLKVKFAEDPFQALG
jgi:hypothetical protein